MNILLLIFFMFIANFGFTSDITTLAIRGEIDVTSECITGDFYYHLHNTANLPRSEWSFFIHPSVNILSVSHNDTQAKIDIRHGVNYRIITVRLSKELPANGRDRVFIRFSINPQSDNPRMTISPEHVFLDARQFWFPYPIKDEQVDFEFTVKTPSYLNSIMGAKLTSEAIIVDSKISTWKNELKSLSPGATLIVTKTPSISKNNINIYSSNKKFQQIIIEDFSPFWDIFQKEYRYISMSQIHIVPIDISIPNQTNHNAEGEFLGNIFLVNSPVVDSLDEEELPFQEWDSNREKLVEILIHELHHGFFPGLIKHQPQDLIFMESLVQTLTWDMIEKVSPEWSKKIKNRTRFYLQNLALNKQQTHLWEFLWNTGLLYSAMNFANLDGKTLVDTLIEKYRFIGYTKGDVFDTISQHKKQFSKRGRHDVTIFENYYLSNLNLFESELQMKKTNFVITVTNTTFFKKLKIVDIPVEATFLSVSHNFPFTWTGQLSWVSHDHTNTIDVSIPQKGIWETNFTESISAIKTSSPLDVFEMNLSDNLIFQNNIGEDIIHSLNLGLDTAQDQYISLLYSTEDKLNTIKNNNHQLIWDSTVPLNKDTVFINAFVVADRQIVKFVSLPVRITSEQYIIYNILDQ